MSHVPTPQTTASEAPSKGGVGRRGAKRERTGGRRTGRKILLGLTVLVLAAGGTGYWLYSDLDGNIKGVDLDKAIGDDRRRSCPPPGRTSWSSDPTRARAPTPPSRRATSPGHVPTPRW